MAGKGSKEKRRMPGDEDPDPTVMLHVDDALARARDEFRRSEELARAHYPAGEVPMVGYLGLDVNKVLGVREIAVSKHASKKKKRKAKKKDAPLAVGPVGPHTDAKGYIRPMPLSAMAKVDVSATHAVVIGHDTTAASHKRFARAVAYDAKQREDREQKYARAMKQWKREAKEVEEECERLELAYEDTIRRFRNNPEHRPPPPDLPIPPPLPKRPETPPREADAPHPLLTLAPTTLATATGLKGVGKAPLSPPPPSGAIPRPSEHVGGILPQDTSRAIKLKPGPRMPIVRVQNLGEAVGGASDIRPDLAEAYGTTYESRYDGPPLPNLVRPRDRRKAALRALAADDDDDDDEEEEEEESEGESEEEGSGGGKRGERVSRWLGLVGRSGGGPESLLAGVEAMDAGDDDALAEALETLTVPGIGTIGLRVPASLGFPMPSIPDAEEDAARGPSDARGVKATLGIDPRTKLALHTAKFPLTWLPESSPTSFPFQPSANSTRIAALRAAAETSLETGRSKAALTHLGTALRLLLIDASYAPPPLPSAAADGFAGNVAAMAAELAGDDTSAPLDPQAGLAIASMLLRICTALQGVGEPGAALSVALHARRASRRGLQTAVTVSEVTTPLSPHTRITLQLFEAYALSQVGRILRAVARPAAAAHTLARSLSLLRARERMIGDGDAEEAKEAKGSCAVVQGNLAICLFDLGRVGDALVLGTTAKDELVLALGPHAASTALARANLDRMQKVDTARSAALVGVGSAPVEAALPKDLPLVPTADYWVPAPPDKFVIGLRKAKGKGRRKKR